MSDPVGMGGRDSSQARPCHPIKAGLTALCLSASAFTISCLHSDITN
jgi:hypothetical protein